MPPQKRSFEFNSSQFSQDIPRFLTPRPMTFRKTNPIDQIDGKLVQTPDVVFASDDILNREFAQTPGSPLIQAARRRLL